MSREFLGVPLKDLAVCTFLTLLVTVGIFLPAIADFGKVMFGSDDIYPAIWVFTHYQHALENGENPFFSKETFYPYGISLALTSTNPLESVIYVLLPPDWSPLGRVTFLQVLSFVLGGIFSFALVYRFTGAFMPSLAGSFVFNFSAFHIEKALHHLNFSMAMPFMALFFLFYFEAVSAEKKKIPLAAASVSLLLLALCEVSAAVMAGFIVLIDIFQRYMASSKAKIITYQNCAAAFLALAASLSAYIYLLESGAQVILTYIIPPAIFLLPVAFVVGVEKLAKAEKKLGLIRLMALCAIPTLLFLLMLALVGSYRVAEERWADRLRFYSTPVEYVILPSELEWISGTGIIGGLDGFGDGGVYLGPVLVLLFLISCFLPGAGDRERYFRDMFLVCVAFAFPILMTRSEILMPTPFVAQPLFPLMGALRSASRFFMPAMLFLAVAVGLLLKRAIEPHGRAGQAAALLLIAILIVERWPDTERFIFDASVPAFYTELSKDPDDASILIANFNYDSLNLETYYQTVHGKKISYGTLGRFPIDEPLASLGTYELYGGTANASHLSDLVDENGYDYISLHKAKNGSFAQLRSALDKKYEEVYEDGFMVVFKTR
jgi:hypothetical protein